MNRSPIQGPVAAHGRSSLLHSRKATAIVAASALLVGVVWAADGRTVIEPGWNMFSPQQDVEVGRQVAPDAERQLSMLNDTRVDRYVNTLGRRLSAKAPGEAYPYEFKVVNDRTINAFALPGGSVYVNRGVIEAADNESQLAGVLAHETAHVALRHGTSQATKVSAAQVPLAILGGLIGSDSTTAVLTQLGASFAMNSVLLKYSRTVETQADLIATQILHDAGYDPRAMAQFFETLESQQQGRGPVEFFSNHPSPDNRIERVNQEVRALGGVARNATTNSREFDDITRHLAAFPGPTGQRLTTSTHLDRPALLVVSARYGADHRFIDVRERLQSRVQHDRLHLQVSNSTMGGDPISRAKTLAVRYQWEDRVYSVEVREHQQLSIPTTQDTGDETRSDRNATASSWPWGRFVPIDTPHLRISHPDDWRAAGRGDAMTITPRGGFIDDGQGNQTMAYGVIVNIFEPRADRIGQRLQAPGAGAASIQDVFAGLERSTNQLVQELRLTNRGMRLVRHGERIRVDGEQALSTYLSKDSPAGGRETDWLVTLEHPEGVLFLVFTAPEREFHRYEGVFHEMLRSVRLTR